MKDSYDFIWLLYGGTICSEGKRDVVILLANAIQLHPVGEFASLEGG